MSTLIERIDKALTHLKVPRDNAEVSKNEFNKLGFRMRSVPLDVHRMARSVAGGKRLSPARTKKLAGMLKANSGDASRINLLGGSNLRRVANGHLRSLKSMKKVAKVAKVAT